MIMKRLRVDDKMCVVGVANNFSRKSCELSLLIYILSGISFALSMCTIVLRVDNTNNILR